MDQSKQAAASKPEPTAPPSPSTNARPSLRRSEAVEEYIARMVAGLNNFKAEK
jgi:hypothetical protein